MPPFNLTVQSFNPPVLPPPSDSLSPAAIAAISPLTFTIALPSRGADPLYPATYLQLSYTFEDTSEIFVPNIITARDLTRPGPDAEPGVYVCTVPTNEVPRMRVKQQTTGDADVTVHAWQGEKFLGKWMVGKVEGLGLVGHAN